MERKRPRRYVGITGFMHAQEVQEAVRTFAEAAGEDADLMVGVLVSRKTLDGLPPGQPGRYPPVAEVPGIFATAQTPPCLRLIHYNSREPDVAGQLARLSSAAGANADGFQLNIAWPDPDDLRRVPACRLVLQVGGQAMKEAGGTPEGVVRRLAPYEGIVTDVLVDPSGGRGLALDVDAASRFVETIAHAYPALGIGVAGGLSADTIADVAPLLRRFPFLSVDAEGRLRDADDRLDLAKATAYVQCAAAAMRGA